LRRAAQVYLLAATVVGALPALAADPTPKRPEISELRFSGIESLPEKLVSDAILTRAPDWRPWAKQPRLDEETLKEDMDRIRAALRRKGFYEARAKYKLHFEDESRDEVEIEIQISEGEPVTLATLEVEVPDGAWFSRADRERLIEDLPLVLDQRFGVDRYSEAKKRVLARLAERGYAAARLVGGAQVDLGVHRARVDWRVVPGPIVRFGPLVDVEGLERVEHELVAREIELEPDQRYSESELEATRRKIYDTGLFRAVTLQPVKTPVPEDAGPEDSVVWPLRAIVDERPPRSLSISAGYGSEEEFRARLAWEHRNFFGDARRLDLSGRYSSLLSGFEGRFRQPRLWLPKLSLTAELSGLHEEEPSFTANRVATGYLLHHPIAWKIAGRIGQRFEYADVTDLDVLDPTGEKSFRLSSLVFGLSRNTLDDPIDPREGLFVDLSAQPTLSRLGSEQDFATFAARASAFTPLPRLPMVVLLARIDLAAIEPLRDTRREEVPIVSRLFAGGTGSVRGFELDQLGPVDVNGDPLGGLTRTLGTLELRFPIWKLIGGVFFADAGQVSEDSWDFEPDNFSVAVGPGLRVKTPIGAIGVDYGRVLRRPRAATGGPRDIDRDRIHFSIGVTY
jgi:outer membrane protein assembly complex protein YaeT